MEAELEAEQRRGRDLQAENRKLSRMLQELRTQSEEDRRAMTELADQVNTLQQRIKTLRRQLDEAVRLGLQSSDNLVACENEDISLKPYCNSTSNKFSLI